MFKLVTLQSEGDADFFRLVLILGVFTSERAARADQTVASAFSEKIRSGSHRHFGDTR